jgi:hypothetical protein
MLGREKFVVRTSKKDISILFLNDLTSDGYDANRYFEIFL